MYWGYAAPVGEKRPRYDSAKATDVSSTASRFTYVKRLPHTSPAFLSVTDHLNLAAVCKPAHHLYLCGPCQASGGMHPPAHCHKEGAAMALISINGCRRRVDDCDDALRIVAVRIRRLKQLRWLPDVRVRRLFPDEHEYHHRLLLRSVTRIYPLECPDESKIETERASLAWVGGIVSCIHFWLGPVLVQSTLQGLS